MSRIDFTPAHTTQIPTRASVPRSADSSNVSPPPRWTPPSPPVANTRMPARSARCEVAATVVAPSPWRAGRGAGAGPPPLPVAGGAPREVADAALGDVRGVGEPLQRGVVEPDVHLPAE